MLVHVFVYKMNISNVKILLSQTTLQFTFRTILIRRFCQAQNQADYPPVKVFVKVCI